MKYIAFLHSVTRAPRNLIADEKEANIHIKLLYELLLAKQA